MLFHRRALALGSIGFCLALAFQNCAPYQKNFVAAPSGLEALNSEASEEAEEEDAGRTLVARMLTVDVSRITDDMVVADVAISGGFLALGAPTEVRRIQILDDGHVIESRDGIYKRHITYLDLHGVEAIEREAAGMTLLPPEELSDAPRCADAPQFSYAVYTNSVRREFKRQENCVMETKALLPWTNTLLESFARL